MQSGKIKIFYSYTSPSNPLFKYVSYLIKVALVGKTLLHRSFVLLKCNIGIHSRHFIVSSLLIPSSYTDMLKFMLSSQDLLSLPRSFDYGSQMRKIALSMTISTQAYCGNGSTAFVINETPQGKRHQRFKLR